MQAMLLLAIVPMTMCFAQDVRTSGQAEDDTSALFQTNAPQAAKEGTLMVDARKWADDKKDAAKDKADDKKDAAKDKEDASKEKADDKKDAAKDKKDAAKEKADDKKDAAKDKAALFQTNAPQARVAGQEDISKRSLISDRNPNCQCPGGKSSQCGCTDKSGGSGCCKWNTCYPGACSGSASSGSSAASDTTNSATAASTDAATVAEAAGCSSASLLQTQYNCNIGTYDSWGYYEKEWCCKPGVMQSPPEGCNMVNAVIAPGAPACCGVLQNTAVAAGCSPSLLQIPGGGMVSATAGAATSATTAAVSETASVSGSYVTVQQTGAAAGCTLSLLQGAENTACCESLQEAAAAAGCSGPSLLQERFPGDEEYENKKNEAKSKAENKKDDAKSKADEKKEDAKSKADKKKEEAKSKADEKKEEAKSKW